MENGYTTFLINFKEFYPETYLKVIEFPDEVVIGWINEISKNRNMITLKEPENVKYFFEMKISVSRIILNDR